jgi:hypothetical protein
MFRLTDRLSRNAEMKFKTIQNGHETTELPVDNLPYDFENFKRDVYQLNSADN